MGLEGYGLRIAGREPIQVAPTPHNRRYLEAKRSKLGHLLVETPASDIAHEPAH